MFVVRFSDFLFRFRKSTSFLSHLIIGAILRGTFLDDDMYVGAVGAQSGFILLHYFNLNLVI